MQKSEMAKVLAFASGADRRVVDAISVETWYELLGNLEFQQVMKVVKAHYLEETSPIFPAHILGRVRESRVPPGEEWMLR